MIRFITRSRAEDSRNWQAADMTWAAASTNIPTEADLNIRTDPP